MVGYFLVLTMPLGNLIIGKSVYKFISYVNGSYLNGLFVGDLYKR